MADGTRTLDEQPAGDEAVPSILRQAAERRGEARSGSIRPAPADTDPAWDDDAPAWDDDASERPAPSPRRSFGATTPSPPSTRPPEPWGPSTYEPPGVAELRARDERSIPRRAWPWVAAGLGLVVAATVVQTVLDDRARDLGRNGARVPGVVAEVVPAEDATLVGGEHIVVEFTWQERPRRKEIRTDEASGYREGGPVTVVVDRSDPERVSVLGEANQAPWTLWMVVLGILGGLGLMARGVWVRVRDGRRNLGAEGWDRDPSPPRRKVRPWMIGAFAVAWFSLQAVTAPEFSEEPSDVYGAVMWVGFWGLVVLTVTWFGFRRLGAGILRLLKAYWNAVGD